MTTWGKLAAVSSIATLFVVGCGGGSSSPVAVHPASVATIAPHSGTPLATATLTIAYPATFHQAQVKSSAAKQSRGAQASRRAPAYINASPQPYTGAIEIFVDGTEAVNTTPTPYGGDSGAQSFSLPIYATGSSQHEIVAVETETGLSSNSTILAIGETDIQTANLTPGSTQAISLTMQQNTEYVGLMSGINDGNFDAKAYFGTPAVNYNNYFTGADENVCSPGQSLTVYPFAADPAGGFAAPIGSTNGGNIGFGTGGVADPILTSWAAVSVTSGDSVTPVVGGYVVTFNATNDTGVLLNFSVTSPALAIYYDVQDYTAGQGQYPGIETLVANGVIQSNSYYSLSQNSPDLVQIDVEPSCP